MTEGGFYDPLSRRLRTVGGVIIASPAGRQQCFSWNITIITGICSSRYPPMRGWFCLVSRGTLTLEHPYEPLLGTIRVSPPPLLVHLTTLLRDDKLQYGHLCSAIPGDYGCYCCIIAWFSWDSSERKEAQSLCLLRYCTERAMASFWRLHSPCWYSLTSTKTQNYFLSGTWKTSRDVWRTREFHPPATSPQPRHCTVVVQHGTVDTKHILAAYNYCSYCVQHKRAINKPRPNRIRCEGGAPYSVTPGLGKKNRGQ